jgi:hypothetical protein
MNCDANEGKRKILIAPQGEGDEILVNRDSNDPNHNDCLSAGCRSDDAADEPSGSSLADKSLNNPSPNKTCSRCGVSKPIGSFPKKDKLSWKSFCSDCWNLQRRKYPPSKFSENISVQISEVTFDWPSVLYEILKSEGMLNSKANNDDEEIDLDVLLKRKNTIEDLTDSLSGGRKKKF